MGTTTIKDQVKEALAHFGYVATAKSLHTEVDVDEQLMALAIRHTQARAALADALPPLHARLQKATAAKIAAASKLEAAVAEEAGARAEIAGARQACESAINQIAQQAMPLVDARILTFIDWIQSELSRVRATGPARREADRYFDGSKTRVIETNNAPQITAYLTLLLRALDAARSLEVRLLGRVSLDKWLAARDAEFTLARHRIQHFEPVSAVAA